MDLAEQVEPELQGPRQAEWLDRLDAAHNNLRAALAWCQSDEGDPRLGIRLVGALWRFWETRGYLQEGRAAAEAMLVRIGDAEVAARAKALRGAGYLAWLQGDTEIAYARLAESAVLERSRDQQHGLAQTLNLIGHIVTKQQDYGRALTSLEEALAIGRALRDDHIVDTALNSLGNIAAFQADYEVARRYYPAVATYDLLDPRVVQLTVSGLSYHATAATNGQPQPDGTTVEVSVEMRRTDMQGDLAWTLAPSHIASIVVDQSNAIETMFWRGRITLPAERQPGQFRIVIKEFES